MKVEEKRRCIAAVRVRGISDVRGDIADTLKMLNLHRNCHAVLIDDRPSYLGMLRKAQSYIAWGEVSKETVSLLLKKRGRLIGDKRLTDEYARSIGYKSLDDLAEAVWGLKVEYKRLPNIKPVFRLHPPRKGFKGGIKKSYSMGGSTGYMGEAINSLLKKMI